MPVRHFYLLSHYICNGLFFLFSVCWLQRNEFNSLGGERGAVRSLLLLRKYACQDFYLLALILYLQWSILFIFCVLAPEGMNSIVLGERRGSGQESATTQEVCLSGIFIYLLSYYICNGLFFLFSVCWLQKE